MKDPETLTLEWFMDTAWKGIKQELDREKGNVAYLAVWVDRFAEQASRVLHEDPDVRQKAIWMLDAMARNWDEEKEAAGWRYINGSWKEVQG